MSKFSSSFRFRIKSHLLLPNLSDMGSRFRKRSFPYRNMRESQDTAVVCPADESITSNPAEINLPSTSTEEVENTADNPPHQNLPPSLNPPQKFITYQLRKYQCIKNIQSNLAPATIFAPKWIQKLVETLLEKQFGQVTKIHIDCADDCKLASHHHECQGKLCNCSCFSIPCISFRKREKNCVLKLRHYPPLVKLQMLSRNDSKNVTGNINFALYGSVFQDVKTIYSLKDLVRQTVIVSSVQTMAYGGYWSPQIEQNVKAYICDLSGLQFQQPHNSGRLVLVSEKELPSGIFDEEIFFQVVGERKKSYEALMEAKKLGAFEKGRYLPFSSHVFKGRVFFDSLAYRLFVANDVLLAGTALNDKAKENGESNNLNFKFLKYGSGFFAGEFTFFIELHILSGVLMGLDKLFQHFQNSGETSLIRMVELPFYRNSEAEKVKALEEKWGISVLFSNNDALKANEGFTFATTNCGDPHVTFGNEMEHQSVDASIAENVVGKGDNFSPVMNKNMAQQFVSFKN